MGKIGDMPISRDEKLSRQYVQQVFKAGRKTCPTIAEAIQKTTQDDVTFPVNDDTRLEISLAILGTSLAILKAPFEFMTAERGSQIETFCKRSIKRDYDMPADLAGKSIVALDEYQEAVQKSLIDKINLFAETSGLMIVRCLGPRAETLCLPGIPTLSPSDHHAVGDLMTMAVTHTITFWKGR